MKTLFIKFLLLFPLLSLGQINKKENYTVYLNYPDYTIKTDVASGLKNIKIKQDLVYYWYSSNKIHETKGGYDGKILNGPFTSFYLSGNLKEKGQLKKGLKNGEWIMWYDNGKIQSIKKWRNGLQTDIYKVFDINGNLTLEEHYKNGKLNGKQFFVEDGKIVSSKIFKNGEEIIPKEKKINGRTNKSENQEVKKKKSFKEKLNSLFKKKEKTSEGKEQPVKKKDENK